MEEKELLERLIRKRLGEGKAKFEVAVGEGKSIDMVFEKEEEIWLIEAKSRLNYEALGQVLTYKGLYERETFFPKNIKLGIVCEETDLEIEEACRRNGVEVFILKEEEEKSEEAPICGICGSKMEKEEGEYTCKTCEYFFGISSRLEKCSICEGKFGSYPAVEEIIPTISRDHFYKHYWKKGICPKCRKQEQERMPLLWRTATVAEWIAVNLKERKVTSYTLQMIGGLPKEFIDYCLGKFKPYIPGSRSSS